MLCLVAMTKPSLALLIAFIGTTTLGIVANGCGGELKLPPETPTPSLIETYPADGDADVARSVWITMTFNEAPEPASFDTIGLDCGAGSHSIRVDLIDETRVVVNPKDELPPSSRCTLTWRGPTGAEEIGFDVAAAGEPAPVAYDRDDASLLAPFPDDIFLVDDADTKTKKVFSLPALDRPAGVTTVVEALAGSAAGVDGFSPLMFFAVALPDALDPDSLPLSEEQSLDPLASILLFDVTPGAEGSGARVPFDIELRIGENTEGATEHTLLVYPSVRLSPERVFALVITRRALVDRTRPLDPSPFQTLVLGADTGRVTDAQTRTGAIGDEVMAKLTDTFPPLERDDIALMLRASVRSMDDPGADLLTVRSLLDELPAPSFTIDDVSPDADPDSAVAAIVTGTWEAPIFWGDDDFVTRDASGAPIQNGTESIPFILALPKVPLATGAPIIMYQHGNPGSAENEVPSLARNHVAEAGFAVIGFTDRLNRPTLGSADPSGEQQLFIFSTLLGAQRFPESIALITNMEQLAFLRLIPALEDVDLLPVGAPDGEPELETSAPLGYLGISNGSNHATGLLAFAPEIHAAALTVGGGRWGATLAHQADSENLYEFVSGVFPDVRRNELFAGLALAQMGVDDQDWLNRAHLLYREPIDPSEAKASVLLTEGIGDSLVPAFSTRAAASEFGLPHLAPVHVRVPFLSESTAPLVGNIDDQTTGGFYQFVPSGIDGLEPSEGCEFEPEGHFCPQARPLANAQRVHFFTTAIAGVPEIIDPASQ